MRKNKCQVWNGVAFITLTQGRVCHVDECDLVLVSRHRWHAGRGGRTFYSKTTICRDDGTRTILGMHRLIMDPPDGMEVDHIDGDGLNNLRSNLRVVTHAQNMYNEHGKRKWRSGAIQSSEHPGVCWDKRRGKWKARIKADHVEYHLGRFDDELAAAEAYRVAKARRDVGERPIPSRASTSTAVSPRTTRDRTGV